jgi:exodeoxyribonuclease-5
MIKNHLETLLKHNLGFEPTTGQARLIEGLSHYIHENEADKVIIIKGYAGTGKTTVINSVSKTLESLKIRTILLAPTGRAAKVITGYTNQTAYTIHKKIYRQKSSADGMGRFFLNVNLYKNTYFIVDEASMISNQSSENSVFGSGRLLDDLLEFVYSGENCRLILVGDTAQLPPVGIPVSPALNLQVFSDNGFNATEYELTDVVRQASDSGILFNATMLRTLISQNEFKPNSFFYIDVENFSDIECISGAELIETISTCFNTFGTMETAVITRSNKRANLFNKGIRNSILYRENEIEKGDLLMVVKNNYFWVQEGMEFDFIANGDIAEVVSIYRYEELYGFRFANVLLRFIDYQNVELECKIFLDTLSIESASFGEEQNRNLFTEVSADYSEIGNKRELWKKIKENPYYNALQVKYAYAITCHKAQGGQWKAVFVDHGYLTEEMLDIEYYRWLYTAFTRPTEKLYLVNFNSLFFEK